MMIKATMEVKGILTIHSYSDEYPSKEDLLFAVEKVPDGAKITSLDINHYSTKSDEPDVKTGDQIQSGRICQHTGKLPVSGSHRICWE